MIGGTEFDATEENIQTRIRTVLLMALQNKTGHILVNSSNKSENALGLCTLYGDTAGAFSPTATSTRARSTTWPATSTAPSAT